MGKKLIDTEGPLNLSFFCLGCECHHGIASNRWKWNGSYEKPTFTPSLLVKMGPKCDPVTHLALPGARKQICHSFITDGRIQYLGDCTHKLAGQTVEIPDVDSV